MSNLAKLGYFFDSEGVLRNKITNSKFKYTDQEAYEALGEAIDEEIYTMLVERCKLIKTPLKPKEGKELDEDVSFIFVSPECQKKENLLVLVHGSGVVRAGQWARRLIINENLECGTQIPYIERALRNDWGIVVLNTNHTCSEQEELKYSRTPVEHASNAWKWWVHESSAKNIFVVAHSRGGYDMSAVLATYGHDKRIRVVCLTDSPGFQISGAARNRGEHFFVINFLAHQNRKAVRKMAKPPAEVTHVHAGTNVHEWTSHCAFNAIFFILEERLDKFNFDTVLERAMDLIPSQVEEPVEEEEDAGKGREEEIEAEHFNRQPV
ncbi:unnamed protein product [Caenorhabditis sp. 36 PRJEB53466]|nr:unnamed protein product [Caenorhabditis sp. 36 PRJEB53466]